jgi:hypothetical protein
VGENIVANLSLFNPVDAKEPIPAVLDVPLEKPILDKCSNYKMTILRFYCPLSLIRPNYLIRGQRFEVRLYSNGVFYPASTNITDIGQSIFEFVAIINDLLRAAWLDYRSANPTIGGDFTYPFLSYDPSSDLFSIVVPWFFHSNPGGHNIDIQVNSTVFYYIAGLPADLLYDGFYSLLTNITPTPKNEVEDRYYLCKFYNNSADLNDPNNPVKPQGYDPTKYNAFRIKAEFSTSYRFNIFQSVLVLSNIPVRQETIPQITSQLTTYLPNRLSYIATLPVLSDFRAAISRYGDQNSELIFVPRGEFRWIDLLSDGPLDRLSFNFKYQLIDQTIQDIMLNPGDSVSIKLYFKSIYK